MTISLNTRVTAVGPEVADLAEGGVVILFADGSPSELAEVSVLHAITVEPSAEAPVTGATISIGSLEAKITSVGASAWQKVLDIGHVVISFNGADHAERPGEICAAEVDTEVLIAQLQTGASIIIRA